jgi:1-acyl-sn-glycerol-3-phosphate acyltransferase
MKLHRILARDDPAVVLKQELMWIPFWGWYAAKARMIPVNRAGRGKAMHSLLTAARDRAERGRAIAIFPQGTRTPVGTWRPYRSGVIALYDDLDLPVVPMALNSGVFWPRRRFVKTPGTITVRFLPPIAPGLGHQAFRRRLQDVLEEATEELVVAAGGPPTPRPAQTEAEPAAPAAAAGSP